MCFFLFLGDVAARIDTDAKLHVDSMNSSVNADKNKAITDLLEAVWQSEAKVHANYRQWTHFVVKFYGKIQLNATFIYKIDKFETITEKT